MLEKCNFTAIEPKNYHDVAKLEDWVTAMKNELVSIIKNQTWQLTELPYKKNQLESSRFLKQSLII